MKSLLCLFFGLIAGALGVYGQVRRDTLSLPKSALGRSSVPPIFRQAPRIFRPVPPIINLPPTPGPRVRIMQPDHMSCVVSDLALVRRMPVQRMKSTDLMPNGIQQQDDEKMPDLGPLLRRGTP